MGVLVDYEGAWDEFQEFLLTRDGWGTRTLLAEMASLRVKHKVPQSDPASTDPAGTSRRPRAVPDANEDPKEDRDGHADQQHPLSRAG